MNEVHNGGPALSKHKKRANALSSILDSGRDAANGQLDFESIPKSTNGPAKSFFAVFRANQLWDGTSPNVHTFSGRVADCQPTPVATIVTRLISLHKTRCQTDRRNLTVR